VKVVFTEKGETEQNRLGADLRSSIEKILQFVPGADLVGLSQLIITDLPVGRIKNRKIGGSYHPKHEEIPAYIEIYLKYIYAHLKTSDSFEMVRPIQEVVLTQVVFHEIGHHVRRIRSHGIKASENEGFAEKYALEMMDRYYVENEQSIDDCFDRLEQMVDEGETDREVVKSMRTGWKRNLEDSIKRNNLND